MEPLVVPWVNGRVSRADSTVVTVGSNVTAMFTESPGFRVMGAAGTRLAEKSEPACVKEGGAEMNAFLDAAVQFIQMGLLLVLVVLNIGIRRRLKRLEDKLGR